MDRDKTSRHHQQQQEHPRERQNEILSLFDLDNRNVLHYCVLCDGVISDESIAAIQFLLHHAPPSLLHKRDVNGKTPLDYVVRRLRFRSIDEDDDAPSILYQVIKLFVHFMVYGIGRNLTLSTESENIKEDEGDVDRGVSVPMTRSHSKLVPCDTVNNHSLNVLQEACLLPRSILLSIENGTHCNLLSYLLSDDASRLEAAIRQRDIPTFNNSFINMAAEQDENGNHALHLFLSNESYRKINGEMELNFEHGILDKLLANDPAAVFIQNRDHKLPLHLAMNAGRRYAVIKLLTLHPDAVHLNDSVDDIKVYMQLLFCMADDANEVNVSSCMRIRYVSTMFQLLRSRPDICGNRETGYTYGGGR